MPTEIDNVSPEIQAQMPDHIDPGSLLASIQHPIVSFLWYIADKTDLTDIKSIKNWFDQQVND
jgi:hypothetical protein